MPDYSRSDMVNAVKDKGLKYALVSVVNVVVGQGLLLFFTKGISMTPWLANVLSVCISAVPAYLMSRAWVFGKTGKNHLTKEVLPFWGMAMIGLCFSTLAVWATQSVSFPLIANVASLGSFGILWVIRFFILDAILFRHDIEEPVVL